MQLNDFENSYLVTLATYHAAVRGRMGLLGISPFLPEHGVYLDAVTCPAWFVVGDDLNEDNMPASGYDCATETFRDSFYNSLR